MREVLAARHVAKRFGAFEALADVDFTLEEGAVCGLIGENGTGKTTFLRVLLGLMKPTAGAVARDTGKPYVGFQALIGFSVGSLGALFIAFQTFLRQDELNYGG